jgi:hypothetical protein
LQSCARLSVAAVAAVVIAAPAGADAAVTIGSDLAPAPTDSNACAPASGACTVTNASLLGGGELGSPIDGVVVRWRARASNDQPGGTPLRLRVIRPAGGGAFTGISGSATREFPDSPMATKTFATRQSIAAGDQIALDIAPPSGNLQINSESDTTWERWQPPLADGETRAATAVLARESIFNADVEPDVDDDGFGDETQDNCPGQPGSAGGCETTPPETTIVKQPRRKLKTRKRRKRVKFKFISSEPGSDFRCEIDGGHGVACKSPYRKRLKRGRHSFEVQAIDPAGNADPTPAAAGFRLKRKR